MKIRCLACMALVATSLALGQEVAQVSGIATDQSGAVVPGVEITLTQTETGLKRSAVTDTAGLYAIPNLPLGPYRLEAMKMGFSTFVQTGIVLQVGRWRRAAPGSARWSKPRRFWSCPSTAARPRT